MGESTSEEIGLLSSETISESESNKTDLPGGDSILSNIAGVTAALTYALLVTVSSASVQLLERRIPDFELNGIRSLVPLVCAGVWIVASRNWPVVSRKELGPVILYGSLISFNALFLYTAVTFLPISSVQSITQTGGLICGLFFFLICLKENVTVYKVISIVFSICGILLTIQPEFLFNWTKDTDTPDKTVMAVNDIKGNTSTESNRNHIIGNIIIGNISTQTNRTDIIGNISTQTNRADIIGNITNHNYELNNSISNSSSTTIIVQSKSTFTERVLAYILASMTGILATINIIIVKKTPFFKEELMTVLFWTYVLGTLLSFFPMLIFESPVVPGNWTDVLYIAAHSFSYTFMWPTYMFAVSRISGHTMNILISSSVVFMLIAQYTVLSSVHPGNENWIEVLGVIFVVLGSSLVPFANIIKKES